MTSKEKAAPVASPALPPGAGPEGVDGWRVVPLEGAYELSYCDEAGNPSRRRVIARELKIGLGRSSELRTCSSACGLRKPAGTQKACRFARAGTYVPIRASLLGKTLLGGIDMETDHYRGFRADRIESLVDGESEEIVYRNVLDRLLKRATRRGKERRRAASNA